MCAASRSAIERATAWNLAHPERRKEIARNSYLKYRQPLKPVQSQHQRFDRLYIPVTESGCWLWLGGINRNGYGKVKVARKHIAAHRWAWELFNGPIPEGVWVLHRCDVPSCVNPDHLFLGDVQANVADCVQKDRHAQGVRNGCAVLTEQDVMAIRRIGRSTPQRIIAEMFNVNRAHISKILNHRNWRAIA